MIGYTLKLVRAAPVLHLLNRRGIRNLMILIFGCAVAEPG